MKGIDYAREHIAGYDRDMRTEPECVKCHDPLDSSNEPSAFCSSCIYLVADAMAEQFVALLQRATRLANSPDLDKRNGDWACAERRPGSDILVEGFRCDIHTILAMGGDQ
jgi:hypothetical protein